MRIMYPLQGYGESKLQYFNIFSFGITRKPFILHERTPVGKEKCNSLSVSKYYFLGTNLYIEILL